MWSVHSDSLATHWKKMGGAKWFLVLHQMIRESRNWTAKHVSITWMSAVFTEQLGLFMRAISQWSTSVSQSHWQVHTIVFFLHINKQYNSSSGTFLFVCFDWFSRFISKTGNLQSTNAGTFYWKYNEKSICYLLVDFAEGLPLQIMHTYINKKESDMLLYFILMYWLLPLLTQNLICFVNDFILYTNSHDKLSTETEGQFNFFCYLHAVGFLL